jgi:superfamily II DNA or RNA helicase
VKLVAAYNLFHSPALVVVPKSARHPLGVVQATDFYCPLPTCHCRNVLFVVRAAADPTRQLAAVFHAFDVASRHPRLGATWLSEDHVQSPNAAQWVEPVRALVAQRAEVATFEERYLAVKAAALDPAHYAHVFVREAADLSPLPPAALLPTKVVRGRAVPLTRTEFIARLAAPLPGLRNAHERLTGAELAVVAMALGDTHSITVAEVVSILLAHGLAERNVRKLTQRIAQSARDVGWFARPDDETLRRLPDALLEGHLRDIRQRPDIAAALAAQAPPPPPPTPAKPAPAKPAKPTRAVDAPAAPAPPAAPPPSAFEPAPRAMPSLDAAALAALVDSPAVTAADVRLSLDAWRLSSAAQFDELLALASMRDITPHRYQTETVRRVLRVLRGRGILADEVGLGKTVEAMMVLREYQVRGMARRTLILVPPSLVAQWEGELAQKAGVFARTTDDPALRESPETFWGDPGVVVASLALARGARHAELVQARPWDMVIVDEAHHIKNRATLGWKLINALQRRFLLLVTATPVENDLEEIYNLVTLLRPGQFDTPAAFRRRFVDPKDPTRPRDREALRALLAEVMVRNTRAQSGLALPPRFVSTVTVDPSPAERELYAAVLAFVRAHHDDPSLRLAATSLLLEAGSSPRAVYATLQKMQGRRPGKAEAGTRRELDALAEQAAKVEGTRKTEALLEVLATQRDPVLVFTRFRETLDEVVARVTKAGVAAVAFHGGLDERARRQALERFREGGAVVMVATATGSEGHNLQHCNVLVNFDLPWNPMAIEQRIGRLHRMGQTREVHVYNLCAKGTIEERVLDVLDRRVQLFQLVVGEMDMVLGNMADDRDLEDGLVAAVAKARSDDEVDEVFDQLARDLLAARGRYEKTRALDEALFGKDFEA